MLCTAETLRQSLDLEAALNALVTDEIADRRMAEAKRERRLRNVRRYLRERAAR